MGAAVLVVVPSAFLFYLAGILFGWGFHAGVAKYRRENYTQRRRYRTSTVGSVKWANGHKTGCVFFAPDNQCICEQFQLPEEPITAREPAINSKESLNEPVD